MAFLVLFLIIASCSSGVADLATLLHHDNQSNESKQDAGPGEDGPCNETAADLIVVFRLLLQDRLRTFCGVGVTLDGGGPTFEGEELGHAANVVTDETKAVEAASFRVLISVDSKHVDTLVKSKDADIASSKGTDLFAAIERDIELGISSGLEFHSLHSVE